MRKDNFQKEFIDMMQPMAAYQTPPMVAQRPVPYPGCWNPGGNEGGAPGTAGAPAEGAKPGGPNPGGGAAACVG
jgi:hypothetical protein